MYLQHILQYLRTVKLLILFLTNQRPFAFNSVFVLCLDQFLQFGPVLPESFTCRTPDLPKITPDFPPTKKKLKTGGKRLVIGCACVYNVKQQCVNIVLSMQGTIKLFLMFHTLENFCFTIFFYNFENILKVLKYNFEGKFD